MLYIKRNRTVLCKSLLHMFNITVKPLHLNAMNPTFLAGNWHLVSLHIPLTLFKAPFLLPHALNLAKSLLTRHPQDQHCYGASFTRISPRYIYSLLSLSNPLARLGSLAALPPFTTRSRSLLFAVREHRPFSVFLPLLRRSGVALCWSAGHCPQGVGLGQRPLESLTVPLYALPHSLWMTVCPTEI